MALGIDESRGEERLTIPLCCARIRPSSKTEDLEKEMSKRNDVSNMAARFHSKKGWPERHKSNYLALK